MRKATLARLPIASTAIALALGLSLAGCGGIPENRSMYSVHQPVVTKSDYRIDVTSSGDGLAYGEQARLAGWFEAVGLKYGDHISIDDPNMSGATRSAIATVADRYGVVLDDATAPTGTVPAGTARITISRAKAHVPGCPDWSAKSDFNPGNATSTNYGCAINSNLAAMVANPEDLVHGQTDTGSTVVMTSNKAIEAYRAAPTTGKGNTVSQTGSKEN
ncbi:pilus assembly protein CpaD [Novosphingobium guangzhouense]|uniref:Pilus assembly protein CpaD n=2 Tax=Novosphingobium guangzhouense TaxID=1850347 RepID=A0A2K2FW77_9SPHN|nr:CpaD family pilus assembly protein [Novosphingobium guangzhouense]PNU03033.1 pilus assembly protein CpaD [Novosphingobium guangzhouense]